ncbi:hypothetical protein ACCO45_006946 [Purpureocillium lilacinum]|uniref:Uncharacterized protein n=1 Tax=Purpureocillium lilacinum TaxID=33203 RepID=A0ACC4DT97_PURLI
MPTTAAGSREQIFFPVHEPRAAPAQDERDTGPRGAPATGYPDRQPNHRWCQRRPARAAPHRASECPCWHPSNGRDRREIARRDTASVR